MDVRVLGKSYTFRTDQDAKSITEAANLVDKTAEELLSKMGPIPHDKVVLLVAMNLAGELVKLKAQTAVQRESMLNKIDQILLKLETGYKDHSNA